MPRIVAARRIKRLAAVSLVAAMVSSGCTTLPPVPSQRVSTSVPAPSDDGPARLSPDRFAEAALDAVRRAGSVRLVGKYELPRAEGAGVDVDGAAHVVTINVDGTATRFFATLSIDGAVSEWTRLDGDVYLRGDAAFVELIGLPQALHADVRLDASDERLADWLRFTDAQAILAGILRPTSPDVELAVAALRPGGSSTVQLQLVIAGQLAGAATIAGSGPALPSSVTISDATGRADLTFSDWGEPTDVERPVDALEVAAR